MRLFFILIMFLLATTDCYAAKKVFGDIEAQSVTIDGVASATTGDISTHNIDTTSVHGITDTSALATDGDISTAVSNHANDDNAHSVPDPTFQTLQTGTNTTATMTVGTGGEITYENSGVVDANQFQGVTTVDATEFGYLDGVTSAVQTQIDGKAPTLGADDNYVTDTEKAVLGVVTEYNVIDYGAVGDGAYAYDGACTGTTFTSATTTFTTDDTGKTIIIHSAGTDGELNHQTTITYSDANTVTLGTGCTTNGTGLEFVYGTDDSSAFQAFLDDQDASEWDTDLLYFKLHPTNILVVPAGKIFIMASGVTATNKDDWIIRGGGTIVFNDINAFTVTSGRRYRFEDLHIDGMTYNTPNNAPSLNTFLYIAATDTTFENRTRAAGLFGNNARRLKHFVNTSGTYNGVELKVWDNHIFTYSVKDSVAINNSHMSDQEYSRNVIYGFNRAFYINSSGARFNENHPYCDYGITAVKFSGDTTSGSATVSNITSTANMKVGRKYSITTGFPSTTVYYDLLSKTATTATFDTSATSSTSGAEMVIYTSDVLYDFGTAGVNAIIQGDSIDNAKIAEIRIANPDRFIITGNILFRTVYDDTPMVLFTTDTALDGIIIKNNNINSSQGAAIPLWDLSAIGAGNLAASVDTELGPNAQGSVTAYDNRWYVDGTHLIYDGTNSGTWESLLTKADLGTTTDTKLCTWDSAGNEIDCNTDPSGGSTTPGGSDTQVQYNNAGAFAGNAGFTFDATNDSLLLTSDSTSSSRGVTLVQTTDDTRGGIVVMRKSRNGGLITASDFVGAVKAEAWDGNTWENAASLAFQSDSTAADGSVGMSVALRTGTNTADVTDRILVGSDGTITVPPLAAATTDEVVCIDSSGVLSTGCSAGGGSSTLADLTDTLIGVGSYEGPLADQNILYWNGTEGEWQNASVGGDLTLGSVGNFTISANAVALTTNTTGNYVSSATVGGGLALTGTEGGSLGLEPCTTTGQTRTWNSTSSNWSTCTSVTAGSGDVSVSGTPVAGDLPYWTNSTTIAGAADIEIDATDDAINIYDDSGAANRGLALYSNFTGNSSNLMAFRKSGGTKATPTAAASGNNIGILDSLGYDGSGYIRAARMTFTIDGTVSTSTVPTAIKFFTGTTGINERMKIDSGGTVYVNDLAGTYTNGSAYVCVNDAGDIFASESACP